MALDRGAHRRGETALGRVPLRPLVKCREQINYDTVQTSAPGAARRQQRAIKSTIMIRNSLAGSWLLLVALLAGMSGVQAQDDPYMREMLRDGRCLALDPRMLPWRFFGFRGSQPALIDFGPLSNQRDIEFCLRTGLADPRHNSLEARNRPGHFVRRRDR